MKSCIALDKVNKMVKFYINGRNIDFSNEEFEELINLYQKMNSSNNLGDVICVYRDDQNILHSLFTK